MIMRVKLKNWRSHLSSELTFSKGTNALLGPIGSGKTSVLDGICFALFGTFPVLQSKKIKLDDVLMAKPAPKDRAEVELEFRLGQSSYFIRRVIERGKGTTYSEIRENGKLLEAPSSSGVTELVERILKVNYELFSRAVYSEQNALDYFLMLPRGQRKKSFDELLMLHRFESARAHAVTLKNRVADRKAGIQAVIEEVDVEELERTLREIRASLEKIAAEREQLKRALDETLSQKASLEKELAEFKVIKERLEGLKQRESAIKGAMEEISNSIRLLEEELKGKEVKDVGAELSKTKERLGELEIVLKDSNLRYRKFSSLEAEQRTKLEALRTDIERLEKEVEEKLAIRRDFEGYKGLIRADLDRELVEKKEAYEKLIGRLESLRFRIDETENILRQLALVKGVCPLCQSKLTGKKKGALIQHKEQHLKALKEEMEDVLQTKAKVESEVREIEALKKKWDEMGVELRDLEQKQSELQRLKEAAQETERALTRARATAESLEKQIGEIEAELKEKNKLREELEILQIKFRDYEGKKAKLHMLGSDLEKMGKEISENESLLAGIDIEELDSRLKGLIAKATEYEGKISTCEELTRERTQRAAEYEKKLEEIRKQREEVKRLEKLLRQLKIFEQALVATQLELREEFIGAINYYMNRIWSTLYPYRDFVGIRLAVEEGDYVLQLQERSGRFIAADGVASGGERSIACLALRVAFSTVLAPQLRWLVLDEPTANLDRHSIKVLAETLRERIGEVVDQCFLITHQEELEEAVTGNIYRLERDKAMDGVTKIISL